MSWKPNPNAMPFQPSNAYYSIKLPCCPNAWKIRKKGLLGRCVQWTLVLILLITVIVNVLFIMDTTSKFRKQQLSNPKGEDKDFEERRQVIIGMYSIAIIKKYILMASWFSCMQYMIILPLFPLLLDLSRKDNKWNFWRQAPWEARVPTVHTGIPKDYRTSISNNLVPRVLILACCSLWSGQRARIKTLGTRLYLQWVTAQTANLQRITYNAIGAHHHLLVVFLIYILFILYHRFTYML